MAGKGMHGIGMRVFIKWEPDDLPATRTKNSRVCDFVIRAAALVNKEYQLQEVRFCRY